MQEFYSRTAMLLGEQAVEKLKNARVAVFGLGGVGGYCAEALVRAGVGALDLVDHDVVSPSNLNRQIIATVQTVGRKKTEVFKERARSVNPDILITEHDTFFLPETQDMFDFTRYDYVVDAIDTVAGKLAIAECCYKANTPLISCMGAGNKLDPTAFRVADIFETKTCPLCRVMRRELRSRGIPALKVVYSEEPPLTPLFGENETKRKTPGSVSFVPSVAGLIAAGVVIKELTL